MKAVKEMTLGELAAYVCTYLNDNSIKCILSGGACVTLYTNNKYQSYDLDFIDNDFTPRRTVTALLEKIGFREENRYFKNKDTKYFIEFPKGPLSVGSEPIEGHNTLEYSTGKLFLLTPTDSVKDRLAAYYHWDDKQSLEQAILISKSHKVNLQEIKRWSMIENNLEKFNFIKGKLR